MSNFWVWVVERPEAVVVEMLNGTIDDDSETGLLPDT